MHWDRRIIINLSFTFRFQAVYHFNCTFNLMDCLSYLEKERPEQDVP